MTRPHAAAYRPDIDGLRAIAVLSVVLYHIRNAWVPGGYVGVDIFFVISGFLITRNIWGEMQAGRFSLADFYLRRIRRIAPAFLAVTTVTLVAGCFLLLPEDLLRLAKSAAWSALSAANIYFWQYLDTGYFAAATAEEPLLHLWSLGVEEQFYLIWPALLMLLVLVKRPLATTVAATIAICLVSFVIAEATNENAQKFAYYMLPARAGELMLGALAAFLVPAIDRAGGGGRSRWLGEAASVAGLGLVAYALWGLDDTSSFPGINAIYPCLGACLLIASGQLGSHLTRGLLARRPVVFIGLISYSLYLWHWPILAFIRYFHGDVSLTHAAIAGMAMLALSVLSYRYVEQPARSVRMPPLRQVAVLFAVPVAAISVASLLIVRNDGLRETIESSAGFSASAAELERLTAPANRSAYPCMDPRAGFESALSDPRCVLGARNVAPTVLLLGDSNAAHYIGALTAVAEHHGFAFRYMAQSTCPGVFGPGDFGAAYSRDKCTLYRETARRFLQRPGLGTVVLASQWAVHDKNPQLRTALLRTIDEITRGGRHVVLLGQVPGFPRFARDCQQRWSRLGVVRCESGMAATPVRPFPINRYMAAIADRSPAVSYVDIDGVLCRSGRCSPYLDALPVYFNPTHLSADGSYRIGQAITASPGAGPAWSKAFANRPAMVVANASMASATLEPAAYPHTVLAGTYIPGFPHKVRSQRHVPAGAGLFQHVVIAEYLRIDHQAVIEQLQAGLSDVGFAVRGPIQNQDAVRYIAIRGRLKMTIDIHAQPAISLVAPGARGLVSFAWRDQRRR